MTVLNRRGVSLIIVIFALMLFAVLAWALTSMLATNFDSSLRILRSDQSLYLAETGIGWARNRLSADSSWRTSVDTDCSDTSDWVNHTFANGQYAVCCRNATAAELFLGNVVAEVRGFVPTSAQPQYRRDLKLIVAMGMFDHIVQSKGVFNWAAVHSNSEFNGDIRAAYYNGDGDTVFNEIGQDLVTAAGHLLPPSDNDDDQRTIDAQPFPVIDMAAYEDLAKTRDAQGLDSFTAHFWEPPMTAKIVTVTGLPGNQYRLELDKDVFESPYARYSGARVRCISRGSWSASVPVSISNVSSSRTVTVNAAGLGWEAGERITVLPVILPAGISANNGRRTYDIRFTFPYFPPDSAQNPFSKWQTEAVRNLTSSDIWSYNSWAAVDTVLARDQVRIKFDALPPVQWQPADQLCLAKRLDSADDDRRGELRNKNLRYFASDLIIDLRYGNIEIRQTGCVAEGDIVIRGENSISSSERPGYPNLATKNGDIISTDEPWGSETTRRRSRTFNHIIFSENGDVSFNYLDAQAVFGNTVTLDGQVRINYDSDMKKVGGFIWPFAGTRLSEE